MDIIIISTILALIVAAIIVRQIRIRKIKKLFTTETDEPVDKSCLLLTIQPCRSIIDRALECLSSHDVIAVCRNHRIGSSILDTVGKQISKYSGKNDDSNVPAIYHSYMLEATEKIAATSRQIITAPDNYVPVSYKCEIETIRESLDRLLLSTYNTIHSDKTTEGLTEEISKDKDFIEHTIAEHTKGMSYKEFDEGASSYSYLVLLNYLHSFMISFSQAVKNIQRQADYSPSVSY